MLILWGYFSDNPLKLVLNYLFFYFSFFMPKEKTLFWNNLNIEEL